jgi:signal transduction histidine kinase
MTLVTSTNYYRNFRKKAAYVMIENMKAARELEPGVLSTFRLFIGVQLVIAVLGIIVHWLIPFHPPSEIIRHLSVIISSTAAFTQLTILAVGSGLLFIYLSIPGLQYMLKSSYLPVGIVWAAAGPILSPYIELQLEGNKVPELFLQTALWQQIILLFIPLIIISWQYSIQKVILFCALTTVLNVALLYSGIVLIEAALLRPLLGILFVQVVAFMLVGYMIANLVKVQREQRQSLTEANARLAQHASMLEQLTISRERNRLARELHDTLAHSLSAVAVQLEAIDTLLDTSSGEVKSLLKQSLATTRNGLTETRRALQALRASPLEDLGLALAIRNLAESVASRSGLRLRLNVPDRVENLSPELEQGIYRVAQEALENVALHAQAKMVNVQLCQNNNHLELTISDNGRGFDPENIDLLNQFGIQGMRERTEMLGGRLKLESRPKYGTTIQLEWGGNNDTRTDL